MTKFILDSGSVQEYKEASELLKQHGSQLWGSTTNPSLIAKALAGKKVTQQEAFSVLQKQIVMDILQIVPGAVSAEVYASPQSTAEEMTVQGKEISTWDPHVVVKLPTTLEGFKARTELRKLGICINNTLVFSQQQVFAITLHEKLMTSEFGPAKSSYPSFISPFVGRLDDIGQDGMSMIENSVMILKKHFPKDLVWMLEASVRSLEHLKKGLDLEIDLITAPAKVYAQWFALSNDQQQNLPTENNLQKIPYWNVSEDLLKINSLDEFFNSIETKKLDISHDLTDKGIVKFVADWSSVIQ